MVIQYSLYLLSLAYFVNPNYNLYGVLDGHGGFEVADQCQKLIPQYFIRDISTFNDHKQFFNQLFQNVNNQIRKSSAKLVGSTCCLFYKKDKFGYVVNLGDTRAVINLNDKAIRLSVDHKGYNEDEQMRVRRSGGQVVRGRLMGQLAVTRSFGDFDYANCGLISQPDINKLEFKGNEKYLIIATDGLWDVVEDQKAVDETKNMKSAQDMANHLLKLALNNGSRDNITIIVIKF